IDASATCKEAMMNARIINTIFKKPLDEKMLTALCVSNMPIVTVDESMLADGLGSMIASFMADHHFTNPIKRIGIENEYVEHGDVNKLLEDLGISVSNIILQSKTLMEQTDEKEVKN